MTTDDDKNANRRQKDINGPTIRKKKVEWKRKKKRKQVAMSGPLGFPQRSSYHMTISGRQLTLPHRNGTMYRSCKIKPERNSYVITSRLVKDLESS